MTSERGEGVAHTNGSLRRVCAIALMPFTEDGELDFAGIDALAGRYLSASVHGITVLGSWAKRR